MDHIHLDTVDSTNTFARHILSENVAVRLPLLITAECQTAGRGRTGHTFYSPRATGIYMTVVCGFEDIVCKCPTTAAAVAVRRVLSSYAAEPEKLTIKWVNDLYHDGKKVCGILTEKARIEETDYLLTGIGINIETEVFPDDISETAGNLKLPPGHSSECYEKIPEKIAWEYLKLLEGDSDLFMDEYRRFSFVAGKSLLFTINGRTVKGRARKINDDGSLEIFTEDSEIYTLTSGEIEITD